VNISAAIRTGTIEAMKLALAEARVHEGATAPNPPVGCVLLDAEGQVLAIGAHERAGLAHAEAAAIAAARANGVADRIGTVVVTLEPCNHHGRTPPCTEVLLQTPARHLLIGAADPNPMVAGGGAERLRAAGLAVSFLQETHEPALHAALERLIAPFAKRITRGLPWLTVKQAINREGTMLPPPGQKTFTSQTSLRFAHELRRRADAIITGAGTILADDPHFTVRHVADFPGKRRKLVLFDRGRHVPRTYIEAATARGFDCLLADDLQAVLGQLAESGVMEALVEAGPQLTSAILASPFWDEHVTITQGEGEDRIDIVTNPASVQQGGADVLRHH
jgi:diaminohydroxyphosphoribosylaminopyrimidine deaminase/5-amino-6-(5-phosphoribosylamino)uracil reductase